MIIDTTEWRLLAAVMASGLGATLLCLYRKKHTAGHPPRFNQPYENDKDIRWKAAGAAESTLRQGCTSELPGKALAGSDAVRYRRAWGAIQGRCAVNPLNVVTQSDQLVRELLRKRGYCIDDFDQRAVVLSVDYAAVVEHYRATQALLRLADAGKSTPADLRQAMVHYRALFEILLDPTQHIVTASINASQDRRNADDSGGGALPDGSYILGASATSAGR